MLLMARLAILMVLIHPSLSVCLSTLLESLSRETKTDVDGRMGTVARKGGLEFSCVRVLFCSSPSFWIFSCLYLGALYIPFWMNALMAGIRRLYA